MVVYVMIKYFVLIIVFVCVGIKGQANSRVKISETYNKYKKILLHNNHFKLYRTGIALLLPDQFRSLFWNEQTDFLLNIEKKEKDYCVYIKTIKFDINDMVVEFEIKNEKGERVKVNKNNSSVKIDKKYAAKVDEIVERQYKLRVKNVNKYEIFADTDIDIDFSLYRKGMLSVCVRLPLKNEGIISNIQVTDYLGFCSFGGFVGVAAVFGAIICVALVFFNKMLILAGIMIEIALLKMSLKLNNRLYFLLRNNLENGYK